MDKQTLVKSIAEKLVSYGYAVYLSKSKDYGFYTDGERVVSFGGSRSFSVNFSGNYKTSNPQKTGTGWGIKEDTGIPTKIQADDFIAAYPPVWALSGATFKYTTPEQYLKTYGPSSGFDKFLPESEEKNDLS